MILHNDTDAFRELIQACSQWRHIPELAVRRDYYICQILERLSESEFRDQVVFKGGTSLSKCYPGSIERFSEDVDLTFIPPEGLTDKRIGKRLKQIEVTLAGENKTEPIPEERNDRNKSSYVFMDSSETVSQIKLEIGSSVRPDPYESRIIKSYIQEYLESISEMEALKEFELDSITVNALKIERTFIDKLMAIKRHAICGSIIGKVRHIYDIVQLYRLKEIQALLYDPCELKSIIELTKSTDRHYLEKRDITGYDPCGAYELDQWISNLKKETVNAYESLHKDILYTDTPQSWQEAI